MGCLGNWSCLKIDIDYEIAVPYIMLMTITNWLVALIFHINWFQVKNHDYKLRAGLIPTQVLTKANMKLRLVSPGWWLIESLESF